MLVERSCGALEGMAEPQAGAGAVVGIEPVDVALDVGVLRHDLGHEAGKFQRRKTRDRGGVELVVLALLCEQLAKGPVSAITVGTDKQQAGIRSERLVEAKPQAALVIGVDRIVGVLDGDRKSKRLNSSH